MKLTQQVVALSKELDEIPGIEVREWAEYETSNYGIDPPIIELKLKVRGWVDWYKVYHQANIWRVAEKTVNLKIEYETDTSAEATLLLHWDTGRKRG